MAFGALRIAWVIYGELEQVSGGYIYDRLVVDELRALGDSVTIISLTPGAPALPALRAEDFDAVIGDELCFRDLARLFRGDFRGLRRVLLIHHLSGWEEPPGAERASVLALEKDAIDSADACVATSHVTADRLYSEGLARRAHVAEPGADRLPRPETGGQEPSGARLRLLFIGNILRRKRVLELCEAFSRLAAPNVELALVGAEPEPDYAALVRELVARAEVSERVQFLGSLTAAAVAEQLVLADALVLPSALEGYGMVLSEALWAAVPVIAARVGAAERLVGATDAGMLYDPDDAGGLGATLGAFVGDAALRRRLRLAAWQAAETLPRWRDTALAVRATLLK
ncbi:MAG TPA: glycosyltransferase family 4 protein [Polyangiaceae bacterium]|nr:glycosyltransferase family 4 protein [Polyangiaceae bacterium]